MSSLRLLDDYDLSGNKFTKPLPLGPKGVLEGEFPNSMRYYINKTTKPQKRASVRLAVKIGSVVEEENERGVAHILEHLAFSATSENINHDVIQKLRSIGCEFGPCLNAYTGMEETVYEFLIPTDDPDFLPQVLKIVAEFAFKIRCASEDLEKERGPVLEEWRSMRQAGSRASQALWQLMHEGSKYADRMPIGLESIIRNVSADAVKQFYNKWYHPGHMAVIVVGDFEDLNAVRDTVEAAVGHIGVGMGPKPPIPSIPWAPHEEPRCKVFVDRETGSPMISLMYKKNRPALSTPQDFLTRMSEDMLHMILNRRLNMLCRKVGCPVYAAQTSTEQLVTNCAAHTITILPLPGSTLPALRTVLLEVARLRLHGAHERELELAKLQFLAEYEQLYQEREQTFSEDLAGEYARHFTQDELVVGAETEARLAKTLAHCVTLSHALAVAQEMRSSCSCTVKVVHHWKAVSEGQLLEVMRGVDALEASGDILPPSEELPPEKLLEEEPEPGDIEEVTELPELKAKQLRLSNGMLVVLRPSSLQEDQVVLSGFAAGGLSGVSVAQRQNASLACTLSEEMGVYGLKPSVLSDVLAGKRVSMTTSVTAFWRTISADLSPLDLDVAMQMLFKLFTTEVVAVQEDLSTTLEILRQQIAAKLRDPLHRFKDHVRLLNYGRSACLRPLSLRDVRRLDEHAACRFFSSAFLDPSEFTLCFVGNIKEEEVFMDMAKRYLASIPRVPGSQPTTPDQVAELDLHFPQRPVRSQVAVRMVQPSSNVQVTFPVELPFNTAREEAHWLTAICKLVEHRLTQRLRFQAGNIYSVSVTSFFDDDGSVPEQALQKVQWSRWSLQGRSGGEKGNAFCCKPRHVQRCAAAPSTLAVPEEVHCCHDSAGNYVAGSCCSCCTVCTVGCWGTCDWGSVDVAWAESPQVATASWHILGVGNVVFLLDC